LKIIGVKKNVNVFNGLYPTVSLSGSDAAAKVNFGGTYFMYKQ